MSEAYASQGQKPASMTGFMLAAVSVLAAILVILGLFYATGIGARRKALLAAGDCAPVASLVKAGLDCTTQQELAAQFTKITGPVIQQLNTDAAAYSASEGHDLAGAEAALKAELTSATGLEQNLARFPFPPTIAPLARTLVKAIGIRIELMARQARSSTLSRLQSFNDRVNVAGSAVQHDLKLVRTALNTRPTASQEP